MSARYRPPAVLMEATQSREEDHSGVAVVENPLFGEQPECWNFQFRHAVQSLKTTSWGLPRSSAAQVISAVRLMSDMGVPKLLLWHMTPGVVVEDATEVLGGTMHAEWFVPRWMHDAAAAENDVEVGVGTSRWTASARAA